MHMTDSLIKSLVPSLIVTCGGIFIANHFFDGATYQIFNVSSVALGLLLFVFMFNKFMELDNKANKDD